MQNHCRNPYFFNQTKIIDLQDKTKKKPMLTNKNFPKDYKHYPLVEIF